MPETRRFAQGLKRKSTTGELKESGSIRASIIPATFESESSPTVPVDYEEFLDKNHVNIKKDPLNNLVFFPEDDFEVFEKARVRRTEIDTVPIDAHQQASSLLVKQCIDLYKKDYNVVENKFEAYAGDYQSLPNQTPPRVEEQIFEVDEDTGVDDYEVSTTTLGKEGVSHKGWLYKALTYTVAGSVRGFKRRFFHLNEFSDHSQILNFYKDEKTQKTPKGAIYLDSCIGVVMNSKLRKHGFEIQMQNGTYEFLAADSDAEANKWVLAINMAIKRNAEALARDKAAAEMLEKAASNAGNGGGDKEAAAPAKSTMHPELMKYARETDHKNAQARKHNRCNVFHLFADFHDRFQDKSSTTNGGGGGDVGVPGASLDGPAAHRKKRLMVTCKSINFSLRGVVQDGAEEPITNVEPFFVTLSLYDASAGRKISADLHVDLNHALVRKMIPEKTAYPSALSPTHKTQDDQRKLGEPQLQMVDVQWIAHPKQGIFTISKPHNEIYLVAKIEKVLQGGIKSFAQPYMRYDSDNSKTALKVLKHVKQACSRLGHYRMPFAWSARPIFEEDHLNVQPSFGYVYKQEPNKISDEDLLKYLSDFKKLDKNSKLEYIDCQFQVGIDSVPTDLPNILTSSLIPVKPYAHHRNNNNKSSSPSSAISSPDAIFEVDEFVSEDARLQCAHHEYLNHCYVYPRALDYDGQKAFPKARNLVVVAEFRDTDEHASPAMRSFYKRPGPPNQGSPFVSRVSTSVLHHHDHPQFYEEWKLELPTQLHHGHHILFSFYHVMVDLNAKKKDTTYIEVGHAWLPLLTKEGHVTCGERHLPVSVNLPHKYLTADEQQFIVAGKHSNEVKWVEGGKALFHVDLSLVSSIYTSQTHLHNFFDACQRFNANKITDKDLIKHIKGLLAVKETEVVRFLPVIINQLLRLMTADKFCSEAQNKTMHALVHVVTICSKYEHDKLLQQYIKYMFVTAPWKDYESRTIHEELTNAMAATLKCATNDFLTANNLLRHSSFFFQIIIKSIAQHLKMTGKIDLPRTKRFPISFHHVVLNLVEYMTSDIVKKWQKNIRETNNANVSVANFIKHCFTYLDRGFVFKLVNTYLHHFSQNDSKSLFELKFTFLRIVCSHEHYIQLNLPLHTRTINPNRSKSDYSFCMDESYCRSHFLVGLLLKHVSSALHSIADVRWIGIRTLRDVIAKHVFDERYARDDEKQRIAILYLPFLRLLLDNAALLQTDTSESCMVSGYQQQQQHMHDSASALSSSSSLATNAASGKPSDPLLANASIGHGSLRMKKPDPAIMNMIANPTSTMRDFSQGRVRSSLAVTAEHPAVSTSSDKLSLVGATPSIASTALTIVEKSEQCDGSETRNLLLCFLQIVENLPSDALVGFWRDSTSKETLDFFDVLELCLHHFRYTGKKMFNKLKSQLPAALGKLTNGKSKTMPGRVRLSIATNSSGSAYNRNISALAQDYVSKPTMSDEEVEKCQMLASNLSTQVALVVLDVIAEYTRSFKKQLNTRDGDNKLMYRIINLLLMFLQIGQSEQTLKHAFASLRLVLGKFPNILLRGSHDMCASFVYHTLRCCDSHLQSTRSEACALLYLLMRKNYEHGSERNFTRSNLQMIKAVSQLISEQIGIGSSRFQSSLSVINTYASSDKGMQNTSFPGDVKNLMKKIRVVLMSTAAMREHHNDPEMTVDLQYRLASSYAATPELRKTWLESMARLHQKHNNFSEAAMCYLHIAALIAEHLYKKNIISKGASAFRCVSPNIEKEECSCKEAVDGLDDDTYNEDVFNDILHHCAELFEKAERYEVLADVFKMVTPYYEQRRNYEELADIHERLMKGYKKVVEVNRNGKRLLGTYFRVAFYGAMFGDEDGKEYIYKEPKLTQLSEISERLKTLYGNRFGRDNLALIQESGKVERKTLDPNMAYVQVTFVQPYFDERERKEKVTYFEQQHNVRNFCFETPFTPSGRARGNIEEQWKRKTICTTTHSFPYIKKRIAVSTMRSFELKPIEVAVEEMRVKCKELDDIVTADRVDIKKLQLRLQGSVNCQVNAGPLAYARAFLDENTRSANLAESSVNDLRNIFRRFVDLCARALHINSEMILLNQHDYHQSLQTSFNMLVEQLSTIMNEQLLLDDEDTLSITTTGNDSVFSVATSGGQQRNSMAIISGTTDDSSIA